MYTRYIVLVLVMLEAEKGNRLQIVHKALLGDVNPCPCLDPAPFPAGDSQKFLEGALIMGHRNPALDGANKPARTTNKSPHQQTILSDKFTGESHPPLSCIIIVMHFCSEAREDTKGPRKVGRISRISRPVLHRCFQHLFKPISVNIHDIEEKETLFTSELTDVREAAILGPEDVALAEVRTRDHDSGGRQRIDSPGQKFKELQPQPILHLQRELPAEEAKDYQLRRKIIQVAIPGGEKHP